MVPDIIAYSFKSDMFKKIVFTFFFLYPVSFVIAQSRQEVSLKKKDSTIEISNGLVGVIIPAETAFKKDGRSPAPIQSFIYNNGIHSDNTTNLLISPTPAYEMKVKLLVNTTAKVTVRIAYRFNKTEFRHGNVKYKGGDAGNGFYNCEITVEKGEKSILMEEEADYDIAYTIKISNGLFPDKARYRGWSSQYVKYGYEAPGKVYRSEIERGYPMDATVDLDYSTPFSYPRLVLWEPAGGEQNSGRYWQVFNSQAGVSSNLFGFFQGKPGRLIGGRSVGVQLEVSPQSDVSSEKNMAVINVNIDRRGPDNSWYPRKRFQWAAFISTKQDLLSPEKQQPIANELNRVSGLGTVIAAYTTKPVKLIPSFYKGAIYLPASDIATICKQIKTDNSLYKNLCTVDWAYKPLWDAWRYPDSALVLKNSMLGFTKTLNEQYTNGGGTYLEQYRYWKGSNAFKFCALAVSALFADESITISSVEKKNLEQLIGLMARIVWDDNNVPLFDSAGINFGPGNMTYMYNNNGRVFFALLLANDPEFKERANQAAKTINSEIDAAIYANGSSFGTPHYTQATVEPILFSMLQLKQAGVTDLFLSNKKVAAFARFYNMLLTPPSVRFMQNRKLISFGDGSEESAAAFVLLATGLKKVDSTLSKELFSTYWYGPLRGSLFGSIGLAANLSGTPANFFTTTTANYSGYASHFRAGINTKNETALWVLNGNGLYDHRNDDAGEIALYALQAPLSLSRSSFYYPSATDARIRSVVVPEKKFPQWNSGDQPIAERSLTNRTWPSSEVIAFANLGQSSSATIKMETKEGEQWYRRMNMINLFEDLPVIVFYDSITGNNANVWSMMMMSEGPVNTPAGPITPEKKINDNRTLKQLPVPTPEKSLNTGLNRFVFTGQNWPAHAAGGINWDLYTCADVPLQFTLSDWATTWQNTIETNEFLQTNKRAYTEEQQIIRLHSNKPFFNVILPYEKTLTPYNNKVKMVGYNILDVEQKGIDIVISPDFFYAKTKNGFTGALFSEKGQLVSSLFSIGGGCAALEAGSDTIKVKVHGRSGLRKIVIPFPVEADIKYPGVSIKQTQVTSVVEINYISEGLDLPNGKKGYKEFILTRKL